MDKVNILLCIFFSFFCTQRCLEHTCGFASGILLMVLEKPYQVLEIEPGSANASGVPCSFLYLYGPGSNTCLYLLYMLKSNGRD